MKKFLLIALLLAFCRDAHAQTATVAGTLRDASGTVVTSNAFVRFELQNFQPSSIPRVSGSGTVVATLRDFPPNGSGLLSGAIYRNDNITPAGTWWRVCTYFGGTRRNCYRFNIAGASFDLDSATPIDTDPVVTAPTGDSTYLRLDGGNQYTGNFVPDAGGRDLGSTGARWDVFAGVVDATSYADTLGVFAATTSAELAGVVSDETGSGGGFMRATSPTITAPVIETSLAGTGGSVPLTGFSQVGASSGNTVTLLNWQTATSAVVGDSTDKTYYTYSLPANVLAAGKGIRITAYFLHSTGTANVLTKLSFGGTLTTTLNQAGAASERIKVVYEIFNITTATQFLGSFYNTSANGLSLNATDTSSVNTASGATTINLTFNVANTDQITPKAFFAELIQ